MKRGYLIGVAAAAALCPMLIAACATSGPMTTSRTPDLPGGVIHAGSGNPAAVNGTTGPAVVAPSASPALPPR